MGELGESVGPFLSPGLCINEAFMGLGGVEGQHLRGHRLMEQQGRLKEPSPRFLSSTDLLNVDGNLSASTSLHPQTSSSISF